MKKVKPLVGIPASVRHIEMDIVFHGNAEQYYDAVVSHTGASCCTIPSLEHIDNALSVVDHLDGILLTGGSSNIHPSSYGVSEVTDFRFFDPLRDNSSFAIIRKALDEGIPLFGICRGLQELNVALGGTLHQSLEKIPGRMNHRSDETAALPEQFHPSHEITIHPGGVLASLVKEDSVVTNSAHMQGIDRLADGLRVEATAEDETIEAVSVEHASGFALAVQFHPEWYVSKTPFYKSLFDAFSAAVVEFAQTRSK